MNLNNHDAPANSWLQEFDHTADRGILVNAGDLKQLFSRCAWGMFTILTEMESVRAVEEIEINVNADDLPGLLVKWLSELNFFHNIKHRVYCRFEVMEVSEHQLSAKVWGEPIDPARHVIYTEIKAVTYHGLAITQEQGVYQAQILFDL